MKNSKIHFIFLFSILFASCVPTKDLIYLQDKGNPKNEVVTSLNQKPYRLQTNDILSISIKAIDPKLVEIFNASLKNEISSTHGFCSGFDWRNFKKQFGFIFR